MNKIILTIALATTASLAISADYKTTLDMQIYEVKKILNKKAANEKLGSDYVTVGDTNDCDYRIGTTRIQDAIDSGASEVRIADGTYNENIIIDDIDLNLKGSYASCADAEVDTQGPIINTGIIAAEALPTVRILGETQRNTVLIDHIVITEGTGGGIAANQADVSLSLFDVWVNSSNGVFGGGISIIEGDTDIVASNLNLIFNKATLGGGIFCDGNSGANSIFIYGDENNNSGIYSNEATNATIGSGGGVYLSNGCTFTSFVGGSNSTDFSGINLNTATVHGGGIYADGGSVVNLIGTQECAFVFCFGYDSKPVNVSNNTADSDNTGGGNGGGIYASGAGTEVNIFNGFINGNEAYSGGGVMVTDEATFTTNTTFKKDTDCWSPGSCNQITENEAISTGGLASLGGAVYVTTGGTAEIHRTHVQNNRADFGTAAFVIDADSSFSSEGSLYTNNGDSGAEGFDDFSVFQTETAANLDLTFATIADNNIRSTSATTNTLIHNQSAISRLKSSIVNEPNNVPIYSSNSPTADTFDCLIVHEDSSFTGSQITVDDPEFIDRTGGDYHINVQTSPAVDYCDSILTTPAFTDIDNQERGFDWPGISNNLGGFDVGFDEQNDVIFADGFDPTPL